MKALILKAVASLAVAGTMVGSSIETEPLKQVERAIALTVSDMGPSERIIQERILTARERIAHTADAKTLQLFDQLSLSWKKNFIENNAQFDFEALLQASIFAVEKNPSSSRSFEIASILWNEGNVRNANVLTAAILHDVFPSANVTREEIEAYFGDRVLYILLEVSDDPTLTSTENKQRHLEKTATLSTDAALITLGEALYELRSLPNVKTDKMSEIRNALKVKTQPLMGINPDLDRAIQQALS